LEFPHGMSVKFGLWTFHKLSKRQKIFDFIYFWLPLYLYTRSWVCYKIFCNCESF